MRAGLVRHDVRTDPALHQLGMNVGAIPDEADGERGPARFRIEGHFQSLVEFEHDSIAISVRHPTSDSGFVDFHIEAHAFIHLDGERLRATHAAHPARQDESTFQGTAEVLSRACRERLVRPLDDPLGSDVRPTAGGHLPVHREAELLELVERLPVRPLRHEVGVCDQDAGGIPMGREHRDRLATLDDQGLVVAEGVEDLDDPMEGLPVPSCLSGPTVDDQLVRLLRVLQVVLEHSQDRLLPPSPAAQRRAAGRLDTLHPDSTAVSSAKPFRTSPRILLRPSCGNRDESEF